MTDYFNIETSQNSQGFETSLKSKLYTFFNKNMYVSF